VLVAVASGAREIQLERSDIERIADPKPQPLPDSLAAMVTLVARAGNNNEVDVRLHSAFGPSGTSLLGRFCHGDSRLAELVHAELREEERRRPDVVFAEVVHLPEGRVGNVLLRPLLRDYEIPFLGVSGASAERQLPLSDLTVAVEHGRVVLRSRRLGREIVPRLTSAHNHAHPRSLGLYRFLCMLQMQGVTGQLHWTWGPLASSKFLPRVRCGRVLLDVARWRLDREQLAPLAKGSDDERWAYVQTLRRTLGLPRFVALEDGDNRLPVDLDFVLSVDSFVHLVKERSEIVLTEMLGGLEELAVRGPEGRFAHELILPLRASVLREAGDATTMDTMRATVSPVATIARRLVPGSDCLYVKLYTGAAGIDQLLRELVAPLCNSARANGTVRDWFFIRYGDPQWHLRLRLFGDADRLRTEVLPKLTEAAEHLLHDGRLWRMQLDTYHREVERYGGPIGMRLCEQMFAADSEAVLAIVELLDGDAGADARWRLALLGTDMLLNDLGFDIERKLALMTRLRRNFGAEFKVSTEFERQVGARFRTERVTLEQLLSPELRDEHPLAPGRTIFRERSARLHKAAAQLHAAVAAGHISTSLESLAASLVHMHINRMLRASQRAHELVIYDFLKRLYESVRARVTKCR
jgi:thiopeptide-type bacteriocin biosynthesis protein